MDEDSRQMQWYIIFVSIPIIGSAKEILKSRWQYHQGKLENIENIKVSNTSSNIFDNVSHSVQPYL
jgi:hypothetical protein